MSSKQFVLILPSNTRGATNTTNRYIVALPKKPEFNGQWQCGLYSISYQHSWPAIGSGHDVHVDVALESAEIVRVRVPPGTYRTPDALADAVNRCLQEDERTSSVRVEYDTTLARYRVLFDEALVKYVAFSKQLYYVLGFKSAQKVRNGDLATHPADLAGGISHLVVYTNITQPVVVGDTMSQLLRIVTVTGRPGENVERVFDEPIYCNVSSREVSSILIDIRTLDNQPVLFASGTVICTLVFRKVALI